MPAVPRSLWLVLVLALALVCRGAANRCLEVCVLDDVECVTRGAVTQYQSVIDGVKGLLGPMDPLYIEKMYSERGSANYSLTNIELTGLRNCIVTQLRLNVTEAEYQHYIHCPQLITIFNYKVKETSCADRNEKVIATASSYDILNMGQFGVYVDQRDHMPHFLVRSVHERRADLKGKVIFHIVRLSEAGGDNKGHKSDIFVTEVFDEESHAKSHYSHKETVEYLFSLIVKSAMRILMNGIDVHCRNHLMGEVLSGAKQDCT